MKAATIAAVSGLLATAFAASPSVTKRASVPQVTVKGNAFFAGDKRFYIRGVDYQPGGSSKVVDPIADVEGCKRDIEQFKSLGLNTIRVYTVDNTADHDECMNALAEAGIYLALDVNTPKYSINRAEPEISYNKVYLQSIFATVDKFQKYDNTLLFFSGNEVINDDSTSSCAPYVKATTRDIKSYINARGYRKIPVGYSAADVDSNRLEMAQYMNCGDDAVRSDFFAFNDYSWCDPSSFKQAGWDKKVETFGDYSIPLFLSEYGCITNERKFNEVASIYSDDMTSVYSGGLVYEYSEEENGYGLAKINGDSVTPNEDFQALKSAFEKTPAPSGDGGYKTNGKASECPKESKTWNVTIAANELPAVPEGADELFKNGARDGPGLQGAGSQSSGTKTGKLDDEAAGAVTSGAASSASSPAKEGSASAQGASSTLALFVVGLVVLASTVFGAALL